MADKTKNQPAKITLKTIKVVYRDGLPLPVGTVSEWFEKEARELIANGKAVETTAKPTGEAGQQSASESEGVNPSPGE